VWLYLNTIAWVLVGFLLMFVFVPSKELTSLINAGGLVILVAAVARLAYLVGIRPNRTPKP
jgi:energy-converting hydrogenase Eha subunit G